MTAIKTKHSEAVTPEKELGIRWGQSPKPDNCSTHASTHSRETVTRAVFSHVQVNVRKKYFLASSISEATFLKRKISTGLEKETLYSPDTA